MDYLSKFSENLKEALKIANQATIEHGAVYVGSEHVIYGFLSLPACSAYGILASEGIAKSEYQDVYFRCIDSNITTPGFTARTAWSGWRTGGMRSARNRLPRSSVPARKSPC